MKRDFKYLTIVHCSKREQADYLYAEVGAATGHTREELAIAFCGPIDDAFFRDREIVPYEEL